MGITSVPLSPFPVVNIFPELSLWPEGTYSVPQSVYGCPRTDKFAWIESRTILQLDPTTDMTLLHSWSPVYHARGPMGREVLALSFCSKIERYLDERLRAAQLGWPRGSYCIYRMGGTCPRGENISDLIQYCDFLKYVSFPHLILFMAAVDKAYIKLCTKLWHELGFYQKEVISVSPDRKLHYL